ncbi:unnamed protein product [Dibothriocephalus latus]|uniref:PDZ domain-containing protein n=1 Tax=Dibothriocephalus latus TaxID=60516 RepID=A0A3P7LSB9_DIBLA|nr:unnamed protein product [Dibothriocephalus latus]
MRDSPAFGKLKNGQVIKRVNGQPVLGLTREEIGELLAAGEEDLILDVQDPLPFDYRIREFGHEYNRRSVEPSGLPRRQSEFALIHRRRDSNASTSSHKDSTADVPNNRWVPAGMHRPAVPNGRPSNGVDSEHQPIAEKDEQGADSMSSLRYLGTQIPSRTFRALASLLGMDDPQNAGIEASHKEPCRTVIDVRAKAEEMKREAEKKASLSGFSPSACDDLPSPVTPASQTVDPA